MSDLAPHMEPAQKNERIILADEASMRKHLEDGANETVTQLEDLKNEREESCVDGRAEEGIVGVPGGNAGEFSLFVSTYERMAGAELTDEQIDAVFDKYLEQFGKFYLHTDEHALHHAGLESEALDPEYMSKVNADEQNKVLDQMMADPKNLGCGHLKLSLQDPEGYDVRPAVIDRMIRSFFKKLWSGHPDVQLEVLKGDHSEGAVLIVQTEVPEGEIDGKTVIPLIKPSVTIDAEKGIKTQTFVYHPQAAKYLRNELAKEVNEVMSVVSGQAVNPDDFAKELNVKGDMQLGKTVGKLARDSEGKPLPVYEALYDKEGNFIKVEVKK